LRVLRTLSAASRLMLRRSSLGSSSTFSPAARDSAARHASAAIASCRGEGGSGGGGGVGSKGGWSGGGGQRQTADGGGDGGQHCSRWEESGHDVSRTPGVTLAAASVATWAVSWLTPTTCTLGKDAHNHRPSLLLWLYARTAQS
jgi:hypothetical protein